MPSTRPSSLSLAGSGPRTRRAAAVALRIALVTAALHPLPVLAAQDLFSPPYLSLGTLGDPALTLGDVDGDGAPDVVAPADVGAALQVALNRGDGSFGAPLGSATIGPPNLLAVADFDSDGRADVACLTEAATGGPPPKLCVQLAAGGGVFGAPTLPAVPDAAAWFTAISALDVNDDGRLDLVLGQEQGQRLTLFHGAGDGSFAPGFDISGLASTRTIAGADVNGDGRLDLVLYSSAPFFTIRMVGVVFGHAGGFDPPLVVLENANLRGVAAGDLDGDGRDELVVWRSNAPTVIVPWLPHAGPGTPIELSLPPLESGVMDARIGDLDADGRLDLALLSYQRTVRLLLQQPDGTLGAQVPYPVWTGISKLALVDASCDGALDILTLPQDGSIGTLLEGQGDGTFEPLHRFDAHLRDTEVADVDADGVPDLVAIFDQGAPSQLLRGHLPSGYAAAVPFDAGSSGLHVRADQLDGDGIVDLLVVQSSAGSTGDVDGLAFVRGLGGGSFAPPVLLTVAWEVGGALFADLNDDGHDDAVLSEIDLPPRFHVLIGDGTGGFVETQDFEAQAFLFGGAFADIDEDGNPDLVAPGLQGQIALYPGTGTGTLLPVVDVPLAADPLRLALGDADADGHVDIACALTDGTLVLLPGHGDGSFGAAVPQPDAASFDQLVFSDLDLDGWLDLVGDTGGLGGFPLVVKRGNGTLVLEPAELYQAQSEIGEVVTADLDADGYPDLVVRHGFDDMLTVLHNQAGPWKNLAHPLQDGAGFSKLAATGTLQPGSTATIFVRHGTPDAPLLLILGNSAAFMPFKGGVLVPAPQVALGGLFLDADGALTLAAHWPAGVPSGATLYLQAWFADAATPSGMAATNGLAATAP